MWDFFQAIDLCCSMFFTRFQNIQEFFSSDRLTLFLPGESEKTPGV